MTHPEAEGRATIFLAAEPSIFVTDFDASLAFYAGTLGFEVVFTHGQPSFYGQIRRGGAQLNLRHVDGAVIDPQRSRRDDLLAATITVSDADALFDEFECAGARFHQIPRTEPWSARTFIVLDPDDNLLLFAAGDG